MQGPLPHFVGRSSELGALQQALMSAPAIVVVDGEAGVGKSRLVIEALAGLGGVRQLRGGCEPVQEPFPLGPVLDAVREHALRSPLPGRLSPVVGALVPYLPEIAAALPPAPPPLGDPTAERHRLFRAVLAVLDDLGPAVLVLEDVHWADAGTGEFVAFLAARVPARLAVVLTLRSEGSAELPIWEALARAGASTRISLDPLPPAQVGELARQLLGSAELPHGFVTSLVEATAGIPFLVEEVLRTASDLSAGLPVPTALRDLLRARWSALDDDTREVLSAAAVLGTAPDEALLTRMVGDPARVARALSRGLAAGLLHEQDGQCRFRHALAWQVIHEGLPPPTRRWLHLRAARLLDEDDGPRPVARLTHHYQQAGATTQFVRSAEAAADLAMSHGDDATAAHFLVPAVQVATLPSADRVRLAGKLARAAVDGLAHSVAVPVLTDLLVEDELPSAVRGELRFMLGRLLRQQGDAEQGYREIERSVDELADRPDLMARALAILAVPDLVVDRPVSVHVARGAQAQALAAGHPRVAVAVGIARTSLAIEIGDPSGWPLVEALSRDPALLGDPREHARACINWAQAALHVGDVARAESLLAETREAVDEVAYLRFAGLVDLIEAWVDLSAGRWDGLLDRARALVRTPREFTAAALDARFLLASVLCLAGDFDEAEPLLRDVVAEAARVGAFRPLAPARTQLARMLLDRGQPQAAADEATRVLDIVRIKQLWPSAADATLCLLDAMVRLGRPDDARPAVDELAASLRDTEAPAAHARLVQCRAELASDGRLFDDARRRFTDLGLRYEQADAEARLGRHLAARGDAAGPRWLEQALRSFDTLGALGGIADVRRTMRGLGVPVPYPWRGGRQSYGAQLSPREREVAALAASGTTNREIAERLFLSQRTVESHVANALRKLGGHSRRELATLLGLAANT
ncbi:ATP-binding protein [Rugosimonospora africana]|uniref:LuxR family transcriptional regulator n=1 Tax=Rugosimonospora africana TaxID=556532 RepID=A0A8J3QSN5_9ACTN|nr:LuxR family transcriptional regulator [Rugosimonospora africana]GIH15277.1 LuxR family transcriptional regulator [Rugosimonospora africana]